MEKDAAGYPQGHTNPGTSRTSPATYPTSRAVLRGGGGGDVTSLPDTWVGNHPGLPGPKLVPDSLPSGPGWHVSSYLLFLTTSRSGSYRQQNYFCDEHYG